MKPIPVHPAKMIYLIRSAIADGVQPSPYGSMQWSIAGGCESPVHLLLQAQITPYKHKVYVYKDLKIGHRRWTGKDGLRFRAKDFLREDIEKPYNFDLTVRCRKCPDCMLAKKRQWTARAFAEVQYWKRTWFVTLTVRPHDRLIASLKSSGRPLREISRWCTLFFKRLRKKAKKLRFLMVFEEHKDGFPHVHMLLHDLEGTLTYRDIEAEWPHGFIHAKLVDRESPDPVRYVCKYITKSGASLARVRASLHYGQPFVIVKGKEPVEETETCYHDRLLASLRKDN